MIVDVDKELSRTEKSYQKGSDLRGSDEGTEVHHDVLGSCCVLFFYKKKNALDLDVKEGNTR